MKQILYIIFTVLISTIAQSQTTGTLPFSTRAYELIPPPPTVGELGKYIEIPVGKYTGIPSISIPLYQINTNNYNMDISLSYHASGIKVQQRAGWVGLGWSLNAGGVITRTVRDQPDDKDTILINPYTNQATLIFPVGKLLPNAFQINYNNPLPTSFPPYWDMESDIFYFNFNGFSGSFIFDENKIPRTTDGNPLKIEYSSINYSQRNIMLLASFTITTPDGIRYIFNDREMTNSIPMQPNTYNYPRYSYLNKTILPTRDKSYNTHISSWYLSRIEFPNTNEKIELSYTPIKYSYLEKVKVSNEFGPENDVVYWTSDTWVNRLIYLYSHTLVDGLMLSQIRWTNGSVSFTPSTLDRQDILTNTTITNDGYQGKEKSLASISVKDYKDNPVKKFDFSYSYFVSDSANQPHVLWDVFDDDIDANNLYYRLKLDAVTESTNLMTKPPYTFSYYEEGAKPNRYSPECDFWGYYNGNGATDMIPITYLCQNLTYEQLSNTLFQSVYLPIQMDALSPNPIIIPGANRNAATTNIANIYSLKRITYPTGGYHTFTFEPNKFRIYDTGFSNGYTEMSGGGIRIKKIERYDPLSNKTDSTKYIYTDSLGVCSGRILNFPLFAKQNFFNFIDCTKDAKGIQRFATSQCDLGTTQGSHVGYNYVKVDNGSNGSEEYSFDMPATFGVKQECFDPIKGDYIYKRSFYMGYVKGGSWDSNYNIDNSKNMCFVTFPSNPYFDWNRGQLLEKKIYNASHQLLKREKNEFRIGDYKYIFGMVKGEINGAFGLRANDPIGYLAYEGGSFVSMHNDICGWKYLSREQIDTYKPETNQVIQEVTTYTYNDKVNKQLSKTQQLQSNQALNTTEMCYATDFIGSAQLPYIQNMLSKNIINKPVELVNYVETNGVKSYNKALLNVYDTQSRLIENWTLDLISPSANFNFAKNLSTASQLNFDNRYTRKQSYIYNSAGKPATSIKENNPPASYLWGYNNAYVVAEIVGADNTALNSLNADITKLENGDLVEQERIRTVLPNALISFYTYRPLVGLVTKTDTRGVTIYYNYDNMIRLKETYIIENGEKKILQKYDYHYASQQ